MTISPEQRLMQAVLHQAFVDAGSTPRKHSTTLKRKIDESDREYAERYAATMARRANRAAKDRDDAREFLLSGTQGFEQICTFAGFNPEVVRDAAVKQSAIKWKDCRIKKMAA